LRGEEVITWIGDGGHAAVCREIARLLWYDKRTPPMTFIAVGDNAARKREAGNHPGPFATLPFATLIHPGAIVSEGATIGEGTVIMAGAVVQTGAIIGKHCILNSGCTVDHHAALGDYAHIAPGAHLCGGVQVGEGALIGVGVGLEPGVKIPAWSVVKRTPYDISIPSHQTA